ncbi:hypothetical protein V8G54_037530 [Vigna mungo]|uniref:Uncharacterized protein n=1 Tax=Vigna mungo TaxID=3915 RepID=A0AAQ3MJB6_VIGMU
MVNTNIVAIVGCQGKRTVISPKRASVRPCIQNLLIVQVQVQSHHLLIIHFSLYLLLLKRVLPHALCYLLFSFVFVFSFLFNGSKLLPFHEIPMEFATRRVLLQ